MARIGFLLMLTLILASPAKAAPQSQLDETRGGAPAYVGLELGAAFPLAFGRYVLFGLEEQPGTFDVFRVGELDGTTVVSYEVLFDDALQSGVLKVSGIGGSAQAQFVPPAMNARDFVQGELNLLTASEPAMLIEPFSVDYTFLTRDYVASLSEPPAPLDCKRRGPLVAYSQPLTDFTSRKSSRPQTPPSRPFPGRRSQRR